jgi:hypothetical protein
MSKINEVLMCLIIGFFIGCGVSYSATSLTTQMQAQKVAALTESYYLLQRESCQKQVVKK